MRTHERIRQCGWMMVIFLSAGCEPTPDYAFERYFIIQQGHHYAAPRLIEMLQSDVLTADVVFDESARYDLHDPALQTNKNKLIGFSDCNSRHHENSARFAWQWFNNSLEIYAYCYVDDARIEQYLGTVRLHESNRYELVLTTRTYKFYLNGSLRATIPRSKEICNRGVHYLLFPYFGGEVPAPHRITIRLSIRH